MLEESEAVVDLVEIEARLVEGIGVREEGGGGEDGEGGEACLPVEESAEELCG